MEYPIFEELMKDPELRDTLIDLACRIIKEKEERSILDTHQQYIHFDGVFNLPDDNRVSKTSK